MVAYHDDEWGRPLHGDHALFERVSLEAFQSGLSWLIILPNTDPFRAAFAGFDIERVASFDMSDIDRVRADALPGVEHAARTDSHKLVGRIWQCPSTEVAGDVGDELQGVRRTVVDIDPNSGIHAGYHQVGPGLSGCEVQVGRGGPGAALPHRDGAATEPVDGRDGHNPGRAPEYAFHRRHTTRPPPCHGSTVARLRRPPPGERRGSGAPARRMAMPSSSAVSVR